MTKVTAQARPTQTQGRTKGVKMDLYTPKLPKLDLPTDAEYAANLVNVNMRL